MEAKHDAISKMLDIKTNKKSFDDAYVFDFIIPALMHLLVSVAVRS